MTIALRDALVRLARDAAARQLHGLAAVYASAVIREITERNDGSILGYTATSPTPRIEPSISGNQSK
jgi:hypothetical protein